MSKLIKVLCFLLVLVGVPLWMMMAGFSFAIFDSFGSGSVTKAQKLMGSAAFAAIWLVPVWVIYFGWRTIKGWRDSGAGSAILMALPSLAVIGFIVAVNVGPFAK
jgi:hypothetical protein